MLFFSILLFFLLGFFPLGLVSRSRLGLIELIGLSFLVGMGQTGLLILLFDFLGGISWTPWLTVSQVVLLSAWIFLIWKKKKWSDVRRMRLTVGEKPTYSVLFFIVLGLVLTFGYMNFYTSVTIPTFDRDGIVAFDVVGYVLSHEQTLQGLSLFQLEENPYINGAGSCKAYAPFFQFLFAYVYWAGAENSRWIPALVYASFLVALYGFSRRDLNPTAAIILVFAVMISPKMFEYSSYSLLNVMQTAFSSLGVLYSIKWFYSDASSRHPFVVISAFLLGISVFSRLEAISFPMVVGIFALYQAIRRKISWKQLIIWCTIVLAPLIMWFIFQKISGLQTESFVISHFFLDRAKAVEIFHGFMNNFRNELYFGNIFPLSLVVLMVSLFSFRKNASSLFLFFVVSASMIFYALMLYHVDYRWDTLANVLVYSSMRFFFSFIPLLWVAVFMCYPVSKCWEWIDNKLSFSLSKKR